MPSRLTEPRWGVTGTESKLKTRAFFDERRDRAQVGGADSEKTLTQCL